MLFAIPIITVIACCLLFKFYAAQNNAVNEYEKSCFNCESTDNVKFEVESVSGTRGTENCIVKGWFVEPGVTWRYYNYGNDAERNGVYNYMNVCLMNDEKVYVFPTKLELREDVNELIGDGIDYKYSGFQANIPKEYSHLIDEASYAFLVQNPDGVKTLYE